MYCCYQSYGLAGIDAFRVSAEVSIARGLPAFEIVGLPDAAVRESRDRVRSAMSYCGFDFPVGKIVLNLAPADRKKSGPIYDVPIFLALMAAQGSLPEPQPDSAFVGELSLSGELHPIRGVLSMVMQAKADGMKSIFVPKENAAEGAVVSGITVYGAAHISELIRHLKGEAPLKPAVFQYTDQASASPLDLSEVKGQPLAKRALEIAAAGNHNLLMVGPPGTGKSMLAKRLPTILPPLTFEEAVETSRIHSVSGKLPPGQALLTTRPFRSPHHTVSEGGLVGGGPTATPGEIALAHNGVLFLDELPEFPRYILNNLRQPMEDSYFSIARAQVQATYPSSIMVVAAMNPCPCGFLGHPTVPCSCSEKAVERYLSRVSGPVLDRMDIQVEVAPIEYADLSSRIQEESSAQVRGRVFAARKLQSERFSGSKTTCNARMTPTQLQQFCTLTQDAEKLISGVFDRMGLSARAYDRILKVARTIADLDGGGAITREQIAEAIQYRSLDRKYWNRKQAPAHP